MSDYMAQKADDQIQAGLNERDELIKEIENLKMVCRRLAAAKSIEIRDRIAKQCSQLFQGNILREEENGTEVL